MIEWPLLDIKRHGWDVVWSVCCAMMKFLEACTGTRYWRALIQLSLTHKSSEDMDVDPPYTEQNM